MSPAAAAAAAAAHADSFRVPGAAGPSHMVSHVHPPGKVCPPPRRQKWPHAESFCLPRDRQCTAALAPHTGCMPTPSNTAAHCSCSPAGWHFRQCLPPHFFTPVMLCPPPLQGGASANAFLHSIMQPPGMHMHQQQQQQVQQQQQEWDQIFGGGQVRGPQTPLHGVSTYPFLVLTFPAGLSPLLQSPPPLPSHSPPPILPPGIGCADGSVASVPAPPPFSLTPPLFSPLVQAGPLLQPAHPPGMMLPGAGSQLPMMPGGRAAPEQLSRLFKVGRGGRQV